MCRLDVVRMIVPPGSSHSFRILVVRNNVVVVGKLFVTDRADSGLLAHLAVQQLPHLSGRSEFAISSRMVGVFNTPNPESCKPRPGKHLPATARRRSVNGVKFVRTESHRGPPVVVVSLGNGGRRGP